MSRSNSVVQTKGIVATVGLVTSMVILLAPTVANPSAQNGAAPLEGVFRIGRTGIYCMRKPCPWRGITKMREDGVVQGKPVWAGDELPIVEASPADRARIRSSWRDSGCLLVQGQFEERRLVVRHITDDC